MPADYFSPGVYIEEFAGGTRPIQGVGTAVAAFVGFTEKAPDNRPHLVTSWTQYTNLYGGFLPDAYLSYAVRGYFENGGRQAYIVSVSAADGSNGDKPKSRGADTTPALTAAAAAIPARLPSAGTSLQIEAVDGGKGGEDIQLEIGPATGDGATEEQFRLVVRQTSSNKEEVFDQLSFAKGRNARNVETVVNRESTMIRVKILASETDSAIERLPQVGIHTLQPAQPISSDLPKTIDSTDLAGNAEERQGVLGLEAIDEITMVCVPDLMSSRVANGNDAKQIKIIQTALLNHCEAMRDRMAILDAPPDLNVQQVKDWRTSGAGYDSMYGAMYYPWVKVPNMIPKAQREDPDQDLVDVPPCGHIAGVYARVDGERGVHKAPANEILRGVIDLAYNTTRNEQDLLNPIGVNCIRAFPNMGIRVWGARTLSSDPAWRYINVRRLFNYVEKSIQLSTQWVVFEPNDMDLWERVTRDLTAFLTRVWRTGALFGATPDEAFYVKCDRETNPPETRDVGQLIAEIGMAPTKPAEFVVFRFTQKALEA